MIHELKCLPEYFSAVASGNKTFEVRKNDRPFVVSDFIALNEYSIAGGYTGRCAMLEITYILDSKDYCKDGFVVLGIDACAIRTRKGYLCPPDIERGGIPVYCRRDNPELLGGDTSCT